MRHILLAACLNQGHVGSRKCPCCDKQMGFCRQQKAFAIVDDALVGHALSPGRYPLGTEGMFTTPRLKADGAGDECSKVVGPPYGSRALEGAQI